VCADQEVQPFAGELFLTLAAEGRLVLDATAADPVIADLEQTLEAVTRRLELLTIWRQNPGLAMDCLPPDIAASLTDTAFLDQLTPGRLERAVVELPKYIAALRMASRAGAGGREGIVEKT
jgi:hypothetical protein